MAKFLMIVFSLNFWFELGLFPSCIEKFPTLPTVLFTCPLMCPIDGAAWQFVVRVDSRSSSVVDTDTLKPPTSHRYHKYFPINISVMVPFPQSDAVSQKAAIVEDEPDEKRQGKRKVSNTTPINMPSLYWYLNLQWVFLSFRGIEEIFTNRTQCQERQAQGSVKCSGKGLASNTA